MNAPNDQGNLDSRPTGGETTGVRAWVSGSFRSLDRGLSIARRDGFQTAACLRGGRETCAPKTMRAGTRTPSGTGRSKGLSRSTRRRTAILSDSLRALGGSA
jgi:hypothetical protein